MLKSINHKNTSNKISWKTKGGHRMGGNRSKVTQLVRDRIETQSHLTLKPGLRPWPLLWLSRALPAGPSLPSAVPQYLCDSQKNLFIIPYVLKSTRPSPPSEPLPTLIPILLCDFTYLNLPCPSRFLSRAASSR